MPVSRADGNATLTVAGRDREFAERRLLGELLRMSAVLAHIESQHSDLLAALEGAGDDGEGAEWYYADYGDADWEGDELEDDELEDDDPEEGEPEWGGGFDAEEFDREFDEWWEAKKNEWD